jgi:hypothetical protein
MNLDKEIARGWGLLEAEVPTLQRDGGLVPKFLVENDREIAIILAPDPNVVNNPEGKDGLAALVRDTVRELKAHTLYSISDAWLAQIDEAKAKPHLVEFVTRIGTKKATEMGLIVRRETLMCSIRTRSGQGTMLVWYYDRDGDVINMAGREQMDGKDDGRFGDLFT